MVNFVLRERYKDLEPYARALKRTSPSIGVSFWVLVFLYLRAWAGWHGWIGTAFFTFDYLAPAWEDHNDYYISPIRRLPARSWAWRMVQGRKERLTKIALALECPYGTNNYRSRLSTGSIYPNRNVYFVGKIAVRYDFLDMAHFPLPPVAFLRRCSVCPKNPGM